MPSRPIAMCHAEDSPYNAPPPSATTITRDDLSPYSGKRRLKLSTETSLPANPDILDGANDLLQLNYTKAGPVLVATNPFKDIHLYCNDYIEAYWHKTMENPHVYTIVDASIREMIRGTTIPTDAETRNNSSFYTMHKPNNLQLPATYEQGLVLNQLRFCGVLEVVWISQSGYPTRIPHQKFARRYGFLFLEDIASQDPLTVSVAILHQFNILPEMYQVGYTKLFRTG